MSYPYGPESYPTWETLERDRDGFATTLYTEHERIQETMLQQKREKAQQRPINIAITPDILNPENREYVETLTDSILEAIHEEDEPYLTETEEMEAWGLAFAHAVQQTGIDSEDIDRLFRDLNNILEDKVIGRLNEEERRKAKENGWY